MQFDVRFLLHLVLPFLLVASACTVPSAKTENDRSVTIASDFLQEADTVLFSSFAKRNKIRIIIRPMNLDEISSEVANKGYNSGIDMVFSQNTLTPIELNKKGFLHDLMEPEQKMTSRNHYISYRHNFVGVGLDPFVFNFRHDSLRSELNYSDLRKTSHFHALSKADQLSFLSPIRRRNDRIATFAWARDWSSASIQRPDEGPWRDSLDFVLCKFSQLETIQDSSWQKYSGVPYFPNQSKSGLYFELTTVAIIRQAEHFTDAQKLLDYFQSPGFNATLNEKINRFPIYDYLNVRKEGPKFYPSNIDQLLKYYDVLDRMLDKINS